MSSKDTLSKIMALLNLQDEVKLASMKLENGTVIEAEEFAPNQEVFIVAENEDKIALPVGEYTLEDGMVLVVAEEGVIAEIKEAEAEAPEEVEVEQAEEEAPKEVALTEERVREIVAEMLGAYKVEMSAIEEEKKAEELAKKEELSKDEPAAKPIKHSPEVNQQAQLSKIGNKSGKDTLSRIFDKLG